MNDLPTQSGRKYTPLPIDSTRGFPQAFLFQFEGSNYRFKLYVNVPANELQNSNETLPLIDDAVPELQDSLNAFVPSTSNVTSPVKGFLVVQVEREVVSGINETIFLRKIVPALEYEVENIAITFPLQKVYRSNINGQGNHGSNVIGGIAKRWA